LPPLTTTHQARAQILAVRSDSEAGRADAQRAARGAKVTPGFYLIGLSNLDADKERNLQLLNERGWFDIPVVYNNNRRVVPIWTRGRPASAHDRFCADSAAPAAPDSFAPTRSVASQCQQVQPRKDAEIDGAAASWRSPAGNASNLRAKADARIAGANGTSERGTINFSSVVTPADGARAGQCKRRGFRHVRAWNTPRLDRLHEWPKTVKNHRDAVTPSTGENRVDALPDQGQRNTSSDMNARRFIRSPRRHGRAGSEAFRGRAL
jgi:hypothetical protein